MLDTTNDSYLELQIKTLYFLAKTKYIPELVELKGMIKNCNPFIQYFLIKKIISLFYFKVINDDQFSQLLKLDEWTNISSLLLINFILKKPKSKKEALKIISLTFKEHLQKLKEFDDLTTFDDLFTIHGLVKHCDGRKFYDYRVWQKDLVSRNYVGSKELEVRDKMNLFCEGRFWKKNEFWIDRTNEHFNASVYWCRGGICYGLSNRVDLKETFIDWSLLEVSEIFNLNLDPLIFSIIGGWANRMNEISERLKCRDCYSILKPLPFVSKAAWVLCDSFVYLF